MAKIKHAYDSIDDVPEEYVGLYTERDGAAVLTGITGIKTQTDFDKLNTSLTAARDDVRDIKAKYSGFGDRDPAEILTELDRIPELEASSGEIDEEKLAGLAEARANKAIAPIQRDLDAANASVADLTGKVTGFETENKTRSVRDSIRKAATEQKVRSNAIDDVLVIGEGLFVLDEAGDVISNGKGGIDAGITPEAWLTDSQETRGYWWEGSQGGGSRGGGSGGFPKNPFTRDNWNMTEQGQVIRDNPDKAKRMASAAGTAIGAGMPAEKKK